MYFCDFSVFFVFFPFLVSENQCQNYSDIIFRSSLTLYSCCQSFTFMILCDKTNKTTFVRSKDSVQPAVHLHLILVFDGPTL